jgi:2-polyprenyl-3-methyl-5-hydroxy-6-metoxy-1,4-benzoquinol methylase
MPTITCPVCHSPHYRVFSTRTKNRIVVCKICRLYYVNPIPEPDILMARVHDSTFYTRLLLESEARFQIRFNHIFAHIEKTLKPGRVLDIGCGIGTGLAVARERGWEGIGIELSEHSVRIAHKNQLDVRMMTLEETSFPNQQFDLIIVHHVLEHITDVQSFLNELSRVLSRKGLLFIAVPNVYAWQFFLQGKRYGYTFHDDHFLHFSVSNLTWLIQNHGFRVAEISTSPWDSAIPWNSLLNRLNLFTKQRLWLNQRLEALGLGREIFCVARPIIGAG